MLKSRNTAIALLAAFCLFTWVSDGFGQDEIDPTKNYAAFHDSNSDQYKEHCTECHEDVLDEGSHNPDIPPAHLAMFEFAAGKVGDDKQCRWCHHRSVDLTQGTQSAATSKGNLRKRVDTALCTLCHGPEGPGEQLYQVGLSSLVTDGGELYELVCAGCHKNLENSEVNDEDADEIQEAIDKDKGGMGPLIALRLEEIQAIADALAQGGGGDDNEDPTAAFTSSCTNLACSFTDQSSDSDGSIASHAWNFGDGVTSTSANPSHTFAVAGTYTISLTVTDNRGGTDSTSQSVTVTAANQAPTAAFSPSCTNLICSFTDQSSDGDGSIASHAWNFGDGVTSTSANPSHTFAVAGTYTVSLTVTDNQGGTDSTSQSVTVTSDGGPPLEVFFDSFESSAWNGLWTEDFQNDWFISSQRATAGTYSAEVDGSATDAQLISVPIDLQGRTEVTITFNWLIERRLNKREYLAFDVSVDGGANWTEHARLRGNVDAEDTWHPVQVDLSGLSSLEIRFRATISSARKDANVDEVRVIAGSGGGTPDSDRTITTITTKTDSLADSAEQGERQSLQGGL